MVIFQYNLYILGSIFEPCYIQKLCYNEQCYKEVVVYYYCYYYYYSGCWSEKKNSVNMEKYLNVMVRQSVTIRYSYVTNAV